MRNKNGFSLLELIIVVAIVTILFAIVGLVYFNILAKTRDVKRVADAVSISKSLKMYQTANGNFPQVNDWTGLEEDLRNDGALSRILKNYISPYPQDPLHPFSFGGRAYSYQYRSTAEGKGYKLHIEREEDGAYEYSDGDGGSLIFNP